MSRLKYIAWRTLNTIILLWVIITVLFLLFRLLPGSYADLLVAEGADQETVETLRAQWGLDQPLYFQYFAYLANFVQLNVGESFQYGLPVWEYVAHRIANTLILVAPGITVGYVIGTIIGTILGSRRGSKLENFGVFTLVMIGSLPSFFTAILFVVFFAVYLDLFPTGGMLSAGTAGLFGSEVVWWKLYFTTEFLHHWLLPFLVVVILGIYPSAMVMRTSVVEVSGQDFMYYNEVSGLGQKDRLIRMAHHAILPVLTLFPISVGQAVSGLVLVELVFNWPGIGYTLIEAVFNRDYPVIQFVFFMTAAFVVIANFFIDIAYGIIDPRISVGGEE